MTSPLESAIAGQIAKHDIQQLQEQYQQHHMLVIPDFLSADWVKQQLVSELECCEPHVHRVNIPKFKKSGSVSYQQLKKLTQNLYQIYQLSLLKSFFEKIVGEPLHTCPGDDPHAAALYYYTEPEDRISVHYDKSFYKGRRYTVLLGLVQDSEHSKLICYPGATKLNRRKNPLAVATHPGSMVIFNGDKLWHEVSPLGENERRVVLTLEYVTDTRQFWLYQKIAQLKDRWLYFGKKARG